MPLADPGLISFLDLPPPVNGESTTQKEEGVTENKDRDEDWTSGDAKRGASPEDPHNE